MYRRILGPVYDNEKENWRILTNKEIYAWVKKPTITETVRLNKLRWFGRVQRMEENRIPKRVFIHLVVCLTTGPKASSKVSSPHSAIQSSLFQMRVSSPFLKVIQ